MINIGNNITPSTHVKIKINELIQPGWLAEMQHNGTILIIILNLKAQTPIPLL